MMSGLVQSSPRFCSSSENSVSRSTLASRVSKSTYGAAASIIVVLVWVYYSSQIILIGAEITHAFAKTQGSKKPSFKSVSPPDLAVDNAR